MRRLNTRSIVGLAVVALGLIAGLAVDGLAACAPGCKICLLDVCSDGPPERPGKQKPATDPRASAPSNDANPLVNIENQLGNLQPSDTSEPVTEWAGMSERDFVLSMAWDWILSGACRDVKGSSLNITYYARQARKPDLTNEKRNELRKRVAEARKELQKAESLIKEKKYDCTSSWSNWEEDRQEACGSDRSDYWCTQP
jgi:hypothetical protein